MDSRDALIHSQQLPFGGRMPFPNSYGQYLHPSDVAAMGGASSGVVSPMSNPNFQFNSMYVPKPLDSGLMGHHQHPHQQPQQQPQYHHQQPQPQPQQQGQYHQQQQQQNGSPASGGSEATPASAVGVEQGKRKRGRPRKYSPVGDGLGLSSNSQRATNASGGRREVGEVNGEGSQGKRQRGRPPGSGKKQLDELGPAGVGFTPHIIIIRPKENIVEKMVEFSQGGPRTICILSAFGTVCNVTLRRPGATDGSGIASYEGLFEIISLSGSFCCVNNDGSRTDRVNLTVTLVSTDGEVLGGVVAGDLIAETDVQIIASSFIAERKKSDSSIPSSSSLPAPAPHMFTISGSATLNSGAQLDANESEDDNGSNGNHSLNHTPQPYNNNNFASHPMPGMQTYPRGWGDMHHNQ